MRSIEFLNVEVEGAGALGSIPFDPFLAAVASLKTVDGKALVSHWINPAPALSIVEEDRFKLRDAAKADVYVGGDTSGQNIAKTSNINSQPTLSITTTPDAILNIGGSGGGEGVNPSEWTLISVCRLTTNNENQRVFGLGGGTLSTGTLWPILEVAANGSLTVREGGTTERRVIFQPNGLLDTPVILGATFSLEEGIAAFKNNMDGLTRNVDDKRPLTDPNFAFLGNRGASNPAFGDFGMAFALRGDISKPEYAAAREVLLGGLMNKYNIT